MFSQHRHSLPLCFNSVFSHLSLPRQTHPAHHSLSLRFRPVFSIQSPSFRFIQHILLLRFARSPVLQYSVSLFSDFSAHRFLPPHSHPVVRTQPLSLQIYPARHTLLFPFHPVVSIPAPSLLACSTRGPLLSSLPPVQVSAFWESFGPHSLSLPVVCSAPIGSIGLVVLGLFSLMYSGLPVCSEAPGRAVHRVFPRHWHGLHPDGPPHHTLSP